MDYDAGNWLPGLTLSAGGRYTWDRRRQRAATVNLATGACGGAGATPPGCILTDTARFDAPSWLLTAAWQASPETLVYLTSRHGYKSGGLNLGQPFAEARRYDPEFLTDANLGSKHAFRSTVELALAANATVATTRTCRSMLWSPTRSIMRSTTCRKRCLGNAAGAELDATAVASGPPGWLSFLYRCTVRRFISTVLEI